MVHKRLKWVSFPNPFRNPKKFTWNPWILCQLLNQLLLRRNANKKITWFSLYYTNTFFPSLIWFHWFDSFFQWISEFLLKRIWNLGIRIVRVVFRLFQINWNQHKLNRNKSNRNRWSKKIKLEHNTMYIINIIDIYIYMKYEEKNVNWYILN